MSGGDWVLVALATAPLAVFAAALTLDTVFSGRKVPCAACGHARERHAPDGCDAVTGTCDCRRFVEPAREDPDGRYACGG
ncbi:hypothetical protein ABZY31_10335 [Streptomyces sp. NPDC006529]|uniref:hypothetical protein n=1 Tax=Streptomyces sp. NPDC006529 TaxID=3157177 RepID=UPI0033B48009